MQNIPNSTNDCLVHYIDASGRNSKTGLSVTVDIYSADYSPIVTAGPCIEIGNGFYYYPRLMVAPGLYPFVTHTTEEDVLQQDIAGCWQIGTWNETGEPISLIITPPVGESQCRVFALCYDQASQTPLDVLTATYKIMAPYYYQGKYHTIEEYQGILTEPDENGNRYIYRDIVWGCRLQVTLEEVGIAKRGTVPQLTQLDVYALQ